MRSVDDGTHGTQFLRFSSGSSDGRYGSPFCSLDAVPVFLPPFPRPGSTYLSPCSSLLKAGSDARSVTMHGKSVVPFSFHLEPAEGPCGGGSRAPGDCAPPPRPLLLPSPGELAGCYTTQGPRFAPLHFSASPRRRASPKASPTARSTLKTFCPVCLSARKLRALQRRSGRSWIQTRGQRPSCCCCGFAFSSPSLPVSLSSSCRSLQI